MNEDEGEARVVTTEVAPAGMQCLTRGQFAIYQRTDTGSMEVFTDIGGQGVKRHSISPAALKILSGEGFLGRRLHGILGNIMPGLVPQLPAKDQS